MNIIFHHPLPLNSNGVSASAIRPIRMLEAFRSLGYNVDIVAGYSSERKVAVGKIMRNIVSGAVYDFLYSESSTMPTLLTDPHHLPLHPKLDFDFFAFCRDAKIPIGLFYRDIYWLFSDYRKKNPLYKSAFARLFYRYDLKKYEQLIDRVYLPSLKMGEYIPVVSKRKFAALPPGHNGVQYAKKQRIRNSLNLLYVGGIGKNYNMHELFYALATLPQIHFTLCTKAIDWKKVQADYPMPLPPNIHIVHKKNSELQDLYAQADIAMLFVETKEYREFSAPFKLYEYLGHLKPIIASKGTLAGRFVRENSIGWEIQYSAESLKSLLKRLLNHPNEIESAVRQLTYIAPPHSWLSRAKQVANDLKGMQ